jgi:hypothetical protein
MASVTSFIRIMGKPALSELLDAGKGLSCEQRCWIRDVHEQILEYAASNFVSTRETTKINYSKVCATHNSDRGQGKWMPLLYSVSKTT